MGWPDACTPQPGTPTPGSDSVCPAESRTTCGPTPEDGKTARDSSRTARLEARISPDVLAIVKRAAEMQGHSPSDFVVAAAEMAQRAIEENCVIRLSLEDQRRFVELLLDPPAPVQALKRAAQAHDDLIRGQ